MVTFMVDLYHDGLFMCNPVRYLSGEHRVIKDINFKGMTYDNFFLVMRRLVLDKPLSFIYVIPGVPMNISLRPISNDEQLNEFVQAYLIMIVIEICILSIKDFQTKGEENADIPKLLIDDPWLNKLVGKGRFVGEIKVPIPGLKGRFFVEQNDPDDNFVEPKYKVKKDFRYPCFDPDTLWNECKTVLGLKFKSPSQLKQCLANYGVTHGYKLWYMQNDTYKLLVKYERDVSAGKYAGKRGKKTSSNR
nr:hypothetical protein [Tanacetum cinerariifolium]